MLSSVKYFLLTVLALVLQVVVLPLYLRDPFKPNLLLVLICSLALSQNPSWRGGILAYLLGLTQDAFSGTYFGLNGFSSLFIYLILRKLADQLYTDSGQLMVVVVFVATFITAFLQLFLLSIFYAAPGIYASFLQGVIPQALVNALAASLLFSLLPFRILEEAK
jgi:rod shape-determining protein MreD